MALQNPVKGVAQSRQAGWLAVALGLGTDTGSGPLGVASRTLTMVAVTAAAVLFGIDQYYDIGLKNQALDAARFDAQSVLSANHQTPQQAAANLAAGVVINGLDGKPIVGKSLEALAAYLSAQAKADSETKAAKWQAYQT